MCLNDKELIESIKYSEDAKEYDKSYQQGREDMKKEIIKYLEQRQVHYEKEYENAPERNYREYWEWEDSGREQGRDEELMDIIDTLKGGLNMKQERLLDELEVYTKRNKEMAQIHFKAVINRLHELGYSLNDVYGNLSLFEKNDGGTIYRIEDVYSKKDDDFYTVEVYIPKEIK